jgi:hypothetical protein
LGPVWLLKTLSLTCKMPCSVPMTDSTALVEAAKGTAGGISLNRFIEDGADSAFTGACFMKRFENWVWN